MTELIVQGRQGIRQKRTTQRETSRDLQSVLWENSAEHSSVHVWEETIQCQGKNNLKGLEGTILEIHTGLEIVCVSISQSGKTCKFVGYQHSTQKHVISAEEKMSPKGCSKSE